MTEQYRHQARKRFGQNFLQDQSVIDKIIHAVGPAVGENLVEIGPGQGALTQPLLDSAGALHAIELDRDLARLLRSRFAAFPEFALHEADALTFDYATLAKEKPLRILGNLPYNISTPLIFHLLKFEHCIGDMHFMLQKEVVERLAAGPGSKTFGRLSVVVQYHCAVEFLFSVPPEAFSPAPKVESAVVRLAPHPQKPWRASDPNFFYRLVNLCFQQRRKTLRNTLKQLPGQVDPGKVSIDLGLRPENLGVADFVHLSNELTGNP